MDTGNPRPTPTLQEQVDRLHRDEARKLIADAGTDGDDRHVDDELTSLKGKHDEGVKKLRSTKPVY